jgi:hypothetical protein
MLMQIATKYHLEENPEMLNSSIGTGTGLTGTIKEEEMGPILSTQPMTLLLPQRNID